MNFSKEDLRNDDIYYGNEANWQFWSVSWYKKFLECEARALAELKEDWEPTSNPLALLVGNYVHSYFETPEAHEEFKRANKEALFKEGTVAQYKAALDRNGIDYKKSLPKSDLLDLINEQEIPVPHGDMYSDFEVAEQMIARIKDEPFFNFLWQGEKEVPITGELFGVKWKGKIDLLNVEEGYFVDLKTSRGFDQRYWSTDRRQYVSFVEAFGYVIQIGIYEKLLEMEYGKPFTGYIYAVSKETPSNIEAIAIEDHDKEIELQMVKQNIDRVEKVKTGQVEPASCGKCEYCRGIKELDGFIYPGQLID